LTPHAFKPLRTGAVLSVELDLARSNGPLRGQNPRRRPTCGDVQRRGIFLELPRRPSRTGPFRL